MAIRPGWIQTYTGKFIYPDDPDPDLICIEDIAQGLAKICRWGGQSGQFYSVAQHSALVSDHVSIENALWGLLHDASDAYLNDIVAPVKKILPDFRELERRMMFAIVAKFKLPEEPPAEVIAMDELMQVTEAEALMKDTPEMREWCRRIPDRIPGLEIFPWDWQTAWEQFMSRAGRLIMKYERERSKAE